MFNLFKKHKPAEPTQKANSVQDTLNISLFGDEANKEEIQLLLSKRDFWQLKSKFIELYENAWDNGEKVKAYLYRKDLFSCMIMEKLDSIKQFGDSINDYEVYVYPCDNDASSCLIQEQIIPLSDFIAMPIIPCKEDCPCCRYYHCDFDIRTK